MVLLAGIVFFFLQNRTALSCPRNTTACLECYAERIARLRGLVPLCAKVFMMIGSLLVLLAHHFVWVEQAPYLPLG
jgi:hypothetical protein